MENEANSLKKNHKYNLVKLPNSKRTLKNKQVFREMQEENSVQPGYKARQVIKGFNQQKGVDFHKILLPIKKMSSILNTHRYDDKGIAKVKE